jgi:hypothetical protein
MRSACIVLFSHHLACAISTREVDKRRRSSWRVRHPGVQQPKLQKQMAV